MGTATDLHEQASSAARAAADRAAVSLRELNTIDEFAEASRLAGIVWNDDGDPKMPSELLRAMSHAGNFVAGAFDGDTIVGFSVGFFGRDNGEVHLHSHITGVHPEIQSKAVGFALKQFQRAWSLDRGIEHVQWTTDPLVRRNAFFNLSKLGASMVAYHNDFYGRMNDGLNKGEESDRVVVRWDLRSARAVAASEGRLDEPHVGDGIVILSDAGDEQPKREDGVGSTLLAWIPPDIVALRHGDPERARAWRLALRETLGRALSAGYRADAMTRNGWYVVTR